VLVKVACGLSDVHGVKNARWHHIRI